MRYILVLFFLFFIGCGQHAPVSKKDHPGVNTLTVFPDSNIMIIFPPKNIYRASKYIFVHPENFGGTADDSFHDQKPYIDSTRSYILSRIREDTTIAAFIYLKGIWYFSSNLLVSDTSDKYLRNFGIIFDTTRGSISGERIMSFKK